MFAKIIFLLLAFGTQAFAAFSQIDHKSAAVLNNNRAQVTGMNCPGANLMILGLFASPGNTHTIVDSSANDWSHHLTTVSTDFYADITVYYVQSPSVSTSMTITATPSGNAYTIMDVSCWSGGDGGMPTQSSGASSLGLTLQSGSVNAVPGDLIVAFASGVFTYTFGIDSGFQGFATGTPYAVDNAGYGVWGMMVYYVAPDSTSLNPTWTSSGSTYWTGVNVVFPGVPASTKIVHRVTQQ